MVQGRLVLPTTSVGSALRLTQPTQERCADSPPPCGEGLGVGGLPTSDVRDSPPPCPSPTRGEGTLWHPHRPIAMTSAPPAGEGAVDVEADVEDAVELRVVLGERGDGANLEALHEQERAVALDAEQEGAQLLDLGLELHADADQAGGVLLARRQGAGAGEADAVGGGELCQRGLQAGGRERLALALEVGAAVEGGAAGAVQFGRLALAGGDGGEAAEQGALHVDLLAQPGDARGERNHRQQGSERKRREQQGDGGEAADAARYGGHHGRT